MKRNVGSAQIEVVGCIGPIGVVRVSRPGSDPESWILDILHKDNKMERMELSRQKPENAVALGLKVSPIIRPKNLNIPKIPQFPTPGTLISRNRKNSPENFPIPPPNG